MCECVGKLMKEKDGSSEVNSFVFSEGSILKRSQARSV